MKCYVPPAWTNWTYSMVDAPTNAACLRVDDYFEFEREECASAVTTVEDGDYIKYSIKLAVGSYAGDAYVAGDPYIFGIVRHFRRRFRLM